MMDLKTKAKFLYEEGFLRDEDRHDPRVIASRWAVRCSTPQKSATEVKFPHGDRKGRFIGQR